MTDVSPSLDLKAVDFDAWVEDHKRQLRPPVNNQALFTGEDFVVQVVGGPNERTDFHVDPYEEWFHQVRGDMHINVMTSEGERTVHIREGETWLLPGNVPHSPQRPQAGSIGIVVERIREEGTQEKFQWYCPQCHMLLHETELQVRDIVVDLPPVFTAFYEDERARTCDACGALHPGKG